MGGYGPNSVLTMPGFTTTDFTEPDPDVPAGEFSDDITFASEAMGYAIDVRVYTPAGTADDAALPVLYITDGSDFWHPRWAPQR
jgi:enterochelin esterase-like enzyme